MILAEPLVCFLLIFGQNGALSKLERDTEDLTNSVKMTLSKSNIKAKMLLIKRPLVLT